MKWYKQLLRILSIQLIRYLQKRYKHISIKSRYNQTSQITSKLILIQSILYYFKQQFNAWGYFHPSCTWSKDDEKYFKNLFPEKNFEELDTVIHHNPEAVTYYHNKIWTLSKGIPPIYSKQIRSQLKTWDKWN